MRFINVLVVAFVLLFASCVQAQSVARITSYDGEQEAMGYGTAFCVGSFNDITVWLTNAHVVESGADFSVLIDGEEYPVILDHGRVKADYDRPAPVDIAVLFGEGLPATACELGDAEPASGERLYCRSFPNASPNEYNYLCEQGLYKDDCSSELFVPYGATVPGCSGSPVFNMDGKVVGIVWAFRPGFHTSHKVLLRDIIDIVGGIAGNGTADNRPYMPGLYVDQRLQEEKIQSLEAEVEATKQAQDIHVVVFILVCCGLVVSRKRRNEE